MSKARVEAYATVCATGALSFHRKEREAEAEVRFADDPKNNTGGKHGPCGPHRVALLVEKNRGPMPKEAPDVLLEVADAAIGWWASFRPNGWSVEQHLGNPRVRLTRKDDKALAEKVAAWVALERGISL